MGDLMMIYHFCKRKKSNKFSSRKFSVGSGNFFQDILKNVTNRLRRIKDGQTIFYSVEPLFQLHFFIALGKRNLKAMIHITSSRGTRKLN